jgi:hypothetical protein
MSSRFDRALFFALDPLAAPGYALSGIFMSS